MKFGDYVHQFFLKSSLRSYYRVKEENKRIAEEVKELKIKSKIKIIYLYFTSIIKDSYKKRLIDSQLQYIQRVIFTVGNQMYLKYVHVYNNNYIA